MYSLNNGTFFFLFQVTEIKYFIKEIFDEYFTMETKINVDTRYEASSVVKFLLLPAA